MTTPVKKIILVQPKARKAISEEARAAGVMRRMQIQTPKSQTKLISSADFRLTILMMRGILKTGKRAPAQALIL
jgi:hypothetical protein